MINLENETELKLTGLSVIKFHAQWCQSCKRLDTILNKMEKEFENVKFYSVDIDKCTNLAKKYKVMSLPTLVFLIGTDETKNRIVGVNPTEQIRKAFKVFTDKE